MAEPFASIAALASTLADFLAARTDRKQRNADEALREYLEWCRRQDHAQLAEELSENRALLESVRQAIDRFPLSSLAESGPVLAEHVRRLLERSSPPPLRLLRLDTGDFYRYNAASPVTFVGRAAEYAHLERFTSGTRPFCWWLVIGPGGSGKSRLADRFARELTDRGWDTGFLEREAPDFDWRAWSPKRPTLVIADYVALWPERVGRLLRTLAARAEAGDLRVPIRVLLLERVREQRWWDGLVGSESGTSIALTESACFSPQQPELTLSPLRPEDLWEIASFVIRQRQAGPLPRAEFLRELQRIDPRGRPLFALFAAEAAAAGRPLRRWDRLKLVKWVLNRELARWKAVLGPRREGGYTNLVALATATGGLSLDSPLTADVVRESRLGGVATDVARADRSALEGLSGCDESPCSLRLRPLEPDVLGECFVLEHVQHRLTYRLRDRLFGAAWKIDQSHLIEFLIRCSEDFPDHPATRSLVLPAGRTIAERRGLGYLAAYLSSRGRSAPKTADTPDRSSPEGRESAVQVLFAVSEGHLHAGFVFLHEENFQSALRCAFKAGAVWTESGGLWEEFDSGRRVTEGKASYDTLTPTTRALALRGRALVHMGMHAEAIRALEIVTTSLALLRFQKRHPEECAEAWICLGTARNSTGDASGACAAFDEAANLIAAPAALHFVAVANRGAMRGNLGQAEGGEADCTAVIAATPRDQDLFARALHNRALIRAQLGKLHAALEDAIAASQVSHASPETLTRAKTTVAVIRCDIAAGKGPLAHRDA